MAILLNMACVTIYAELACGAPALRLRIGTLLTAACCRLCLFFSAGGQSCEKPAGLIAQFEFEVICIMLCVLGWLTGWSCNGILHTCFVTVHLFADCRNCSCAAYMVLPDTDSTAALILQTDLKATHAAVVAHGWLAISSPAALPPS